MTWFQFEITFLDGDSVVYSLFADSYVIAWQTTINKLWAESKLPQVAIISPIG